MQRIAAAVGSAALVAGTLASMPLSASATPTSHAAKKIHVPSSISVAADVHKYKSGQYIVQLKDSPAATYAGGISGLAPTRVAKGKQLNAKSSTVKKYSSYLRAQQSSLASKLGITPMYNYSLALNGFSAKLSATQVARLVKSSDVASVTPSRMLHITDEKSIDYLGITGTDGTWDQLGGEGNRGAGVVVGDLDTGIAPENASFAGAPLDDSSGDEPYLSSANTISYVKSDGNTFSSAVVTGEQFTAADYSTKIIAGRFFVDGFGEDYIGTAADDKEYLSARDGAGHGSHTASTAAGDAGVEASVNGTSYGTISGVAPDAKIAAYKVCWTGNVPDTEDDDGCAESDIVAGIEAAVADGVDVLNFSIGGSAAQTTFSASDAAFLNAASAGIFVSAAAGNAGLGDQADDSSLDNAAPWETTVAASTFTNSIGTLVLGADKFAGPAVIGADPVSGEFVSGEASAPDAASEADVANAAKCIADSLDPDKVAGTIVECDRGTNFLVDKAAEVKRAGGIGMVLQNTPTSANTVFTTSEVVPNIHLTAGSYNAVKAYADHGNDVTLAPTDLTGSYPVDPVPQITTFSSHGPVLAAGSDVLKPDIAAPGQFILAAVANAEGETGKYDFYDGTSMATPHITGLAALYLSKDPQASPAEIKSALMTTAVDTKQADGSANEDPFGQGAGEVHPTTFLDPGLVYLADESDWKSYLVGTGQAAFDGVTGIDGSDLNQASIAIGDLTKTQTVSRDVTALTAGVYTATIDVPGITATVSPSTLDLSEGETGHFTVTFARSTAPFDAWSTGFLTWSSADSHDVRSPVAIHPTSAIVPASIDGVGTSGSKKVALTAGFTGDLPVAIDGLATGVITANDDDATLPYTGVGHKGDQLGYAHEIEPGTTFARFDLEPVTSGTTADLDLDVYYAADEDALESGDWSLVGTSATPSASESVVIPDPESSGFYITLDTVFDAPAGGIAFNDISYIMSPSTNVPGLSVDPNPIPVKQGKQSSYMVSWEGLEPNHLYLGVLHYGTGDGSPASFVTIVSSPDNLAAPTIGGDVAIGGTATADPGSWNISASSLDFAYQWTLDGVEIAGATGETYVIPDSAYGKKLGLTVSASVDGQQPTTADAAPVTVAGSDGNAALTNLAVPTITGTAHVGSELSVSTGSWNVPVAQLSLAYQWTANGTPIPGATSSSFTATAAQLGSALGATVTATAASNASVAAASALPVMITGTDSSGGLINVTKPTVTGTAQTGKTLTVDTGTWNVPADQLTYTYQWINNGDAISGATSSSYTVPASAGGDRIGVTVTAHIGSESEAATSAQVSIKSSSTTTISLSDPTITTKVKEKVTVRVKADGSGKETGTVVVHYDSKTKTDVMHSGDHGKIVVTLPKLKKGTYTIWAEYKGNSDVVGDKSIKKNLKVRKA
jgi:hypothetical protein